MSLSYRRVVLASCFLLATWAVPSHAITWTGATLRDGDPNNNSNSWQTAENWDLLRVPQAGDTVTIDNGDTIALAGAISVTNLDLSNGTLADGGSGTLTLVGPSSSWSGGQILVPLTVNFNAALTMAGTSDRSLDGTAAGLSNSGTIAWQGGRLVVSNGYTIDNFGTFDLEADGQVTAYGGGSLPHFNNSGALTKSAGGGTASLDGIFFNNGGSVTADAGTIGFTADGSQNGHFTANAGFIEFSAGHQVLTTGTALDGTGHIRFNGATIDLQDAIPLGATTALDISAGAIIGSGSVHTAGTMNWTGGVLSGAALTIDAGGTLNLSGDTDKAMDGGTVTNNGTANWSAAGRLLVANAATIANNGSFNVQGDGAISVYNGGSASNLNNAGTLTKTSGAGTASFDGLLFNNSGNAIANSGALALTGGGTDTGSFAANGSATLDFSAGNHIFNTGVTIGGTGQVRLNGGTISLGGNATVNAPGTLGFSAGTVTGGGTLSASGTINWTGGILTAGNLAINNGAALNISGNNDKVIDASTITNAGTAVWTGTGRLVVSNGSTIANSGSFDVQDDGAVSVYNGGQASNLNNSGTFTKSLGGGTASLDGIAFNNTGTTSCGAGTLALSAGGTSNGSFSSTSSGSIDFTGGIHNFNNGLTLGGNGHLRLNGATLNLAGSATVVDPANFDFLSGTITGAGSLAVGGVLNWQGGLAASTTVTINNGGRLFFTGSLDKACDAAVIDNNGTATWSGPGRLVVSNATTFNNNGTFGIGTDGTMSVYNGGSGSSLNNAGTLTKSAGSGTTSIDGLSFNNSGTARSLSGTLALSTGGGDSGVFSASGAAVLAFTGGTHGFNAGTTISGTGHVTFAGATILLGATVPLNSGTTLDFSSGTVTGGGNLTVDGTLNWTSGLLSSTTLNTSATGVLNLSGTDKSCDDATINNAGTTTWNGPGRLVVSNGTTIANSGTFDVATDGAISAYIGGEGSTFSNSGLMRKSGGSGTSPLDGFAFNNTGTAAGLTGSLAFTAGGTSTGTFNATGDGTLDLTAGNHIFNPGVAITGDGHVRLNGATLDLETALPITTGANFDVVSGNVSGSGSISINGGTVNWQGGTVADAIDVDTDGTLAIAGTADKVLTGAAISNSGTTTWAGPGRLLVANGCMIDNAAGATFDLQTNGSVFASIGGASSTLNNAGTLSKSGGSDVATVADVIINQNNRVDVTAGIIGFTTPVTFGDGASFTGSLTRIEGAAVTVMGACDVAGTLELNSGSVDGPGAISTLPGGQFNWTGGTLHNTVTNVAGGTLTIAGNADKLLDGGTLNNAGTATWTGSGRILFSNAGTVANAAGGVFNWQTGNFTDTGGATSTFSNAGTINLGPPIGAFTIDGTYTQTATGTLNFLVGGNNAAVDYDQLFITGAATLDGLIGGVLTNGFKPPAGVHFDVMSFPSRSGAFVDTTGPFLMAHNATAVELISDPPTEMKATLYGEQEVQTPGVVSDAGGAAAVSVNGKRTAVTVDMDTAGLANVTAAHIHVGAIGANGSIAFSLYSTSDGAFPAHLNRTLTAGDFASSSDAATFSDALDAIIAGNAYINVHTAAFGSGEIRGQLVPIANLGPTITSLSPTAFGVGGTFDIAGTDFVAPAGVRLNGRHCPGSLQSDTHCTANIIAGAASGQVIILTPSGASIDNMPFTVEPAPAITDFTPTEGATGSTVTINGSDLTNSSTASPTVFFNGTMVDPAGVTVVSASQVLAVVPDDATTGKITVSTTGGIATSADDFTVFHPPVIADVAPASGAEGMTITITGVNLTTPATATPTVQFNGTPVDPANITVDSSASITVTVPTGATTGKITLETSDGIATSAADFTVVLPPAISDFTPTLGGEGLTVTINGTDLTNATTPTPTVQFNGVPVSAGDVQVESSSRIHVLVPANASTGTITVETTGGIATSADVFSIVAAAALSSFSPTSGSPGNDILIFGSNFTNSVTNKPTVKFNLTTVPDTLVTVLTPSALRVTVPVGATTGKITVTTSGGSAASTGTFTVVPKPTVTGFTPTSGALGREVIIVGASMTNATTPKPTVKFNLAVVPASDVTVIAASQIKVKVPKGALTGKVSVITTGGTAVSTGTFTVVLPPTVTTFVPPSGAPGAVVTVNGTNFINPTTTTPTVKFNGRAVTPANVTVISATQLRAVVPLGAPTGSISVETTGGVAASAASFTVVNTPTISGFSPVSGGAGTVVTVAGTSFTNATTAKPTVKFNTSTVPATDITIVSTGQLKAVVPVGATSGKISITTTGGTAASAASFTVVPKPTINNFTPSSGAIGATVTVNGSNFTNSTTTKPGVQFNNAAAPASGVTVVSANQIKVDVPAGATSGKISITTTGGTATSSGTFTVVAAPTVSGFTPTSGAAGAVVTINGANLTNAATATPTVKFNGLTVVAANVTAVSSTQIKALVPSGATTGKITVETSGGSATSAGTFTVVAAPTLTGFTPATGPAGTSVTINGSSFTNATTAKPTVKFNTTTAAGVTVVSASQIKAVVPTGATTGKIAVTTTGGTVESTTLFTVVAKPTISSFSPASAGFGATVTINGANLTNATTATPAVKFNGIAAVNVSVISPNQVKANVPVGATSGRITVETSGGIATSAVAFTVLPSPLISAFTPPSGPVGTLVVITGTNLATAAAAPTVWFNGVPVAAANVTVVSANQITAMVPSGAGSGLISVTTAIGSGASAAAFTVTGGTARAISSISLSGATTHAATATITLTFSGGLDADTATDASHYVVTINGKAAAVESIACAPAAHQVTLGLPEGGLHVGDTVTVAWTGLLDTQGRAVAGSCGPFASQ